MFSRTGSTLVALEILVLLVSETGPMETRPYLSLFPNTALLYQYPGSTQKVPQSIYDISFCAQVAMRTKAHAGTSSELSHLALCRGRWF